MRKSAIVLVGLGVIAALIAWFLMLDRDGSRPRPDLGAGAPEPPTMPMVAESRKIDTIRPKALADPDAAGAPAISPEEALRVLIVNAATGTPVPGAEVAWTDEAIKPPSRFRMFGAPSTLITDFDHAAQRTFADASGVAVVRTSERLAVAARSEDRFGLRRFEVAPRGEIRLPIAPGQLVAARVVTEGGAPVSGVVVMASISARGSGRSTMRNFYARSREPDGLAIVHHTGVVFEGPFGIQTDITEVTASIEGSGPEGRAKATAEDLRAGPITLILRPTGRVLVKVSDTVGKPLSAETRIALTAAPASDPSWPARFEATTTGGTAEFAMVTIGSVLTASAESSEFDTVTLDKVEGPVSQGETKTIELRFVRPRAVVRGQAVDETGSPLSRREMEAELVLSARTLILPAGKHVATDAQGEFSFTIDRGMPRLTDVDLLLEIRNGDAIERHARVPFPKLTTEAESWLGEVLLFRPEVLAAGFVRDELGTPLAGAIVTVEHMRSMFPPGFTMSVGSRSLPQGAKLFRARTDELGAFEIPLAGLGPAEIIGFSLEANLAGYACLDPPTDVKPGRTRVNIVLRGTGAVEGRLLMPDLAPVRSLSLSVPVTDPATGSTTNYRFEDCIDSGGAFRVSGLQPGLGKLEVRLSGIDEPLASIPNVAVPRLATANDLRLREIDLRGHPALRAK